MTGSTNVGFVIDLGTIITLGVALALLMGIGLWLLLRKAPTK
jgi:hypothetical protein